ncbi:MAG: DNA-directed RNA polymerase, subunit E'' [Candidatus Methanolliviera hydrocarbonicum]|jgi:DNA-directed RNA polymerase, subunit E'''' (EC 2.7.7.6)|uniref:Transcription elongation factor Spt4 n=1 Tax=Candidatus Methanolliviera hydrocarbonicum TaxID=2491085 RepID=A0A520KXN1_9EURY|nr:MAG: DNA-directed RNA polymerase, subunit E'' [Candidatus Methanolliviera hydrocarbonicum]
MKACRTCHLLLDGSTCPICHSNDLSDDWSGYVIIIDPSRSNIAKKLNIKLPGSYALRVR